MNIAALIAIIAAFGFDAYPVETDTHIYAFSYATAAGTNGHPKAEAAYSFESGILSVKGPNASYEKQILCKAHGDDECPMCHGQEVA